MLVNDRYDDIESIIKGLPKIGLTEQAENRIILQMQAEQARDRRKQYHRKWGKSLLMASFAVIILILLVPNIPYYINELKGVFVTDEVEEDWPLSPTFDLYDRDGTLIYRDRVRGVEGRIGFLDVGDFAATERETGAKMFWYVWGDPEQLVDKELVATAVHQRTGETFILNRTKLMSGFYGADAHNLTQFEPFPLKGIWRIDVEIDGKPYGSIVIHVKDQYVRTKSYRFVGLSKDDLIEGVYLSLRLDGNNVRKLERIEVNAIQLNNRSAKTTFYLYDQSGSLYFDQPGKWQLEILGEKTTVEVRAAEAPWQVSPVFQITDPEHLKGMKMQGIEGRFAFPPVDYMVGQKQGKMLGLLWGDVEQYWGKDIVLTAEKQHTGKKTFITKDVVREPWDGIGTHVMTSFNAFPSTGIWRVDIIIDGDLYGSMVVNVKQGYPSTRTGRLMQSAEDFYVGMSRTDIEIYGEQLDEEVVVTATFIDDPSIMHQSVYKRKEVVTYGTDTLDPYDNTRYVGSLNFDREGKWEIDILDSKTDIYVKSKD